MMIISFHREQKQPITQDLSLFGVALATDVLDGKSAIDAVFDVQNMRTHLIFLVIVLTFKKLIILDFRFIELFSF